MQDKSSKKGLNSEKLAYWFFRLNGCMTIENFLVHRNQKGWEGTEVDLLGVRLPHRQELALDGQPMEDYPHFSADKIDIVIAEVKKEKCGINGPWTDPNKRNMHRVLYSIGAVDAQTVDKAADALYKNLYFENDMYRIQIFAVGATKNNRLHENVVQLTWHDILGFIYERFSKYRTLKQQNWQWDHVGRRLYNSVRSHKTRKAFVSSMLEILA